MSTHDVDNPFWSLSVDWPHRVRVLAGNILKRRDIVSLKEHLGYIGDAVSGNFVAAPHNTFDMIMDISEAHGLTSYFFFMTAQGRDEKDGNYGIMHPEVVKLACRVLDWGHKIDIHPGFCSKDTAKLLKTDADKLRQMTIAERLLVEDSIICIGVRRSHGSYYEAAGITYDATLSYADHIGFRCGICFDYPVYNVVSHERWYKLREHPLEVMESSGLGAQYMNLNHEEMLYRCRRLKEKQRKIKGYWLFYGTIPVL